MELKQLGWNASWEQAFAAHRAAGHTPGRVVIEDRHHFMVATEDGAVSGIIPGKWLHENPSTGDLPKVGDWIALEMLPEGKKGVIRGILPRRTRLSRKAAGRDTEEQVLVTNVDVVFLVQPLDRRFNPTRLQRQLVMVHESGARPVALLNKSDLCDDAEKCLAAAQKGVPGTDVFIVSAKTGKGLKQIRSYLKPGVTTVFIGASGAGKSSLINRLYGDDMLTIGEVRESDSRGRHTTTWRELVLLPNGGLVIDTPGTREFSLWLAGDGLQETFPDLEEIAVRCHYRNCSHTTELRCAVQEAVEKGDLNRARYENYVKLKQELAALPESQQEHLRSLEHRRSQQNKSGGRRPRPILNDPADD